MSEICVAFKIRLPSAKKIQTDVSTDQENINSYCVDEAEQETCWTTVANVSLKKSHVVVSQESNSDANTGGKEPQTELHASEEEEADTDSESEYEYEEVTVTDDSECGDSGASDDDDDGVEFVHESKSRPDVESAISCPDRDSAVGSRADDEEADSSGDDKRHFKQMDVDNVEVSSGDDDDGGDGDDDGEEEEEEEEEGEEPAVDEEVVTRAQASCQQLHRLDVRQRQANRLADISEGEEELDDDEDSEDEHESDSSAQTRDEQEMLEKQSVDEGDVDDIISDLESDAGDERADEIPDVKELHESDEESGLEDTILVSREEERERPGPELLPNADTASHVTDNNSRVVMFDHEIVKFTIRRSGKAVKITEIIGVESEEDETIATPDPQPQEQEDGGQTSGIPVFTFKLRRSRTENAFEETSYDAEEEEEENSSADGGSSSQSTCSADHAFATSGEEIDDDEDEVICTDSRKRVKRSDSFDNNSSLLAKVLVLLSFTDRIRCESVSKTWYSIIKEVNRSHQSSLGVIGVRSRNERLQNFCPQRPHRVDQSDCVSITSNFEILPVLSKVPNLQSLHIRCDGSASVFHDVQISAQVGLLCPQLEHISLVDDISGSDIYDHVLPIISNCTQLKHIQLRFPCKSSTMVRENFMVRKCLDKFKDQMEVLSVNVPLHEDTCANIANFCRLRKLSLHGTTIPMPGLVYLLERGNIRGKYIKCFNIVIDTKDQLEIITKNMVCLHSFHCVFSQFATKHLQPKDVKAIGRLKNLRTLFLSIWTNQLIDEGLIGVALGCRQLSSLTVNAEVSDQSVKYLGSFCPLLERLELNTTIPDLITDASIDSLLQLKQLRYLTFYYCDLSDEGIHRLLTGTKELELLSISFSRRMTCKTVDIVSRFAEEKPWERVILVLPQSLNQSFRWTDHDIPRNLEVSFNA